MPAKGQFLNPPASDNRLSRPRPVRRARHRSAQLNARLARLEEARKAAEASNEAKSLFLANIIHEIRTPMNAILGYAQLLQRAPDIPRRHRNAIETIERSGGHLLALINDVLDLSKIEAGCMELQLTDFDLSALLYDLSAMFDMRSSQKLLRWRVEIWHPPNLPIPAGTTSPWVAPGTTTGDPAPLSDSQYPSQGWRLLVRGDERKLRQVLINLLSNAVKFTERGEVVLKVVLPHDPPARGFGSSPAKAACFDAGKYYFEVRDTGPGIAPEAQAGLFQAFHQGVDGAEKGGTGLGLTIATRLISLMGGELHLESQPGAGSRFFFTIPLRAAEADLELLGPLRPTVCRLKAGCKIDSLIVDDVRENREVLGALLMEMGCEVRLAETGPEALELIRQQVPNIIFMDIRMPGMNGLETMRRIVDLSGPARAKIVACSASALTHQQQQCLSGGFDAFIAKPFRFEGICKCLEHELGAEFEFPHRSEHPAPGLMTLDYAQLRLPAALHEQLKATAELYGTTEFKLCVRELEQLGERERLLAARFRELLQSYDMQAILNILAAIPSASGSSKP